MMDEVNKNELMEQYLLGQLTGELLAAFEEKLASDAAFRQEVALEKAILKNLRKVGRQEWALKLENFHQEMESAGAEETPVIPLKRPIASEDKFYSKKVFFAIAATIVLLLLATIILITINNKTNPQSIFVAYYEPYPSVEQVTRNLPNNIVTERTKAFGFYNNGNYSEAIKSFNSILANGEDEVVLFYLGNAYLSANKPQEAENTFISYLHKYKEFEVESKWYLGLSYLKQEKVKQARQLLDALAKQNNDYSHKATALLESLGEAT